MHLALFASKIYTFCCWYYTLRVQVKCTDVNQAYGQLVYSIFTYRRYVLWKTYTHTFTHIASVSVSLHEDVTLKYNTGAEGTPCVKQWPTTRRTTCCPRRLQTSCVCGVCGFTVSRLAKADGWMDASASNCILGFRVCLCAAVNLAYRMQCFGVTVPLQHFIYTPALRNPKHGNLHQIDWQRVVLKMK